MGVTVTIGSLLSYWWSPVLLTKRVERSVLCRGELELDGEDRKHTTLYEHMYLVESTTSEEDDEIISQLPGGSSILLLLLTDPGWDEGQYIPIIMGTL